MLFVTSIGMHVNGRDGCYAQGQQCIQFKGVYLCYLILCSGYNSGMGQSLSCVCDAGKWKIYCGIRIKVFNGLFRKKFPILFVVHELKISIVVFSSLFLEVTQIYSWSFFRISHSRWMAQIVACLHASLQTTCLAELRLSLINNTCLTFEEEWFMKSSMQSCCSVSACPRYKSHYFVCWWWEFLLKYIERKHCFWCIKCTPILQYVNFQRNVTIIMEKKSTC